MNSALSASPVALCECFCREKNKNEKKIDDDDVNNCLRHRSIYNNDIFAVSPPMHVLAIYFDSALRYNMCVYTSAQCAVVWKLNLVL